MNDNAAITALGIPSTTFTIVLKVLSPHVHSARAVSLGYNVFNHGSVSTGHDPFDSVLSYNRACLAYGLRCWFQNKTLEQFICPGIRLLLAATIMVVLLLPRSVSGMSIASSTEHKKSATRSAD